ncbi:carbamoyl phosphate synthase large subunit [Desulfuribacillus stibiiarsenatis]|uniref:Carbamoyl phosphate synthase large chain n=1 Tax=Desulfuribacillus stibiiarsenatis TaxID=1390249 RepID=A0A1E5L9I1_9FIRM|nr:carbamoyl-phosphate synthase (glutamine-hydrolyzing) large subunit [Desulfuribacillus stibiiarsenatis]OEH86786.1 carbamoyl phosphate synthase large subunit [Desulfuribacillus stibiiarsenatis]
MPKIDSIKKVLVIGSGPIIIGQAAEFDYAGTQACNALKEEGIEVVLVNSNPATIMTDQGIADKIYIEPLTVRSLSQIIDRERPDGVLPTLGGQTGLNLAVKLSEAGVLEKYNVKLLGTSLEAIKKAEDRDLFRTLMLEIGQPIPESEIIDNLVEAEQFAARIGFPLIIRPAYTLGGSGGGIVDDHEQLRETVSRGLSQSPIGQVLIEKSIKGWKEIEYEVMRDSNDTCITICNMENFDPVGVHTGDSIVVAPSQTLSDCEYQLLRTASLDIIRSLKIEGGCNVQLALNPYSFEYCVIEVNPRVSRSSALASKATGYPIAKVAAKIAIGMHLDEIINPVTGLTYASFEPALDYVVAKIPRWPFDKFPEANRKLGTQMKATGEVMAIARTMEGALLKAVRSLEIKVQTLLHPVYAEWTLEQLTAKLAEQPDDNRLFILAEALRKGMTVQKVRDITEIDPFFVEKILNIVRWEEEIKKANLDEVTSEQLRLWKKVGFSDAYIADLINMGALSRAEDDALLTHLDVRKRRKQLNVIPSYKLVDTCAAEFPAKTPYYYSTYTGEDEVEKTDKEKILVIGSGPIRIGQGIEFDYCSVHAIWALKEAGYEAVIINNNPETVSTDFNVADRLYFEPLTLEDVLNVAEKENIKGAYVQFGGQTAINLVHGLRDYGIQILGTSVEGIDLAEDRDKFRRLLDRLQIPQTNGAMAENVEGALKVAEDIGYPLMVRPSYVIGGRGMQVIYEQSELERYLAEAVDVSPGRPVLLDQYLPGKEVEVDAVCDAEDVLIPGIFEHIERAGVHSGDSMAVYPPQNVSQQVLDTLILYTTNIAREMSIRGLINIQYVIVDEVVYVLEVNPRASRTVPIISKVTDTPLVQLATRIGLGDTLKNMGYTSGLIPNRDFVAVKAPIFSFEKMSDVDISLGPEMKSTGEVLGIARNFVGSLGKVFATGHIREATEQRQPGLLCSISDREKEAGVALMRKFASLGFKLYATPTTAKALEDAGLEVTEIPWQLVQIREMFRRNEINLVINIPTIGKDSSRQGFKLRRMAVEFGVGCLTALDTADALCQSIEERDKYLPFTLEEFLSGEFLQKL